MLGSLVCVGGRGGLRGAAVVSSSPRRVLVLAEARVEHVLRLERACQDGLGSAPNSLQLVPDETPELAVEQASLLGEVLELGDHLGVLCCRAEKS